MSLSSDDPRNPNLDLECSVCAMRLEYIGTVDAEPRNGSSHEGITFTEAHFYRCARHGLFRLNDHARLRAVPPIAAQPE